MNPVLSLPILVPLLVILLGVGLFLSWRSSRGSKSRLRWMLILLRSFVFIALATCLLNPGEWIAKQDERVRLFPVMIDDSASMATELDQVSRSQMASKLMGEIQRMADQKGVQTPLYAFAENLKELSDLQELTQKGEKSDVHKAGSSLFTNLQAGGRSPEAVFILTDGRQTSLAKNSTLALQARANNAPIYAVSIGENVKKRDLSVIAARKTITAFPKQSVQVTAVVENSHLGNQSVTLDLLDDAGERLLSQMLEISENKRVFHTFSVEAPEKSMRYQLVISKSENEQILENNRSFVNVRVLTTKTRVFIAEGAPYWDSKFLAQLLRQQGHMDVHSVHRLRDDRWFRIDSGQSDPTASSDEVFPNSMQELARYDLIVLGKNSEHFLTDRRIELLKNFVKDQGGAILFSRGKAYSGKLQALEALEPVTWARNTSAKFTFSPTADGQSAGLFGQALPAPESRIWASLPDLKDAYDVDSVKPFTRVLAEGSMAGVKSKLPLLMVRRYGQGVTGLVNADGLWKWDFYPEARELGNMYQEFWTQLIQWMVAYSEFLPGHDYSLHASRQIVMQQVPVVFSLSYRGASKSPKPMVEISIEGQEPVKITAAASTNLGGKLSWKCSFIPDKPGAYVAKLITDDGSPSPMLNIEVKAPPSEMDNLNPDPKFLRELCESTGGKLIQATEIADFVEKKFGDQEKDVVETDVIWKSSWMQWFVPIILLFILAAEWWVRRRSGLI